MEEHIDKSPQALDEFKESHFGQQKSAIMGSSCGRKNPALGIPITGFIIPIYISDRNEDVCIDPKFGDLMSLRKCFEFIVDEFALRIQNKYYEPHLTTVRNQLNTAMSDGRLPHLRLAKGYTLGTAKSGDMLVNHTLFRSWLRKQSPRWKLKSQVDRLPARKCPRKKNKPSFLRRILTFFRR